MNNIDTAEYGIVVNHALQYSIWPTHLALSSGYKFAGAVGTRAENRSSSWRRQPRPTSANREPASRDGSTPFDNTANVDGLVAVVTVKALKAVKAVLA